MYNFHILSMRVLGVVQPRCVGACMVYCFVVVTPCRWHHDAEMCWSLQGFICNLYCIVCIFGEYGRL